MPVRTFVPREHADASVGCCRRPMSTLSKNISRKGPRTCRSLHGTPHGKPGRAGQVGFPGFPVESCGFGQLHVVLFGENT